MTINDLARELNEMYNNAPNNEQSLMIRLFGIRFAKEIRNGRITPLEIIKFANEHYNASLTENYQTEINKGIKLAKYVIDKKRLKDFIDGK
jgi:5-methylcytosine-specific restriction protein B